MEFSRQERETFVVENYNPGPGFYYNFNKQYQQEQMNQVFQDQFRSSWATADRFQYKKQTEQNQKDIPSVGTYNIQTEIQPKKRPQTPNQRIKLKQGAGGGNDQNTYKVNAIPSIPSSGQIPGYQEIGDGLLILMKEPRKNDDNQVNPQSYDVTLTQTKKKTPTFFIKEHTNKNILKEAEEIYQQQQLQQEKEKSFEINPFKESNKKLQKSSKNKNEISKTLQKSQSSRHVPKKDWLSREDYNLELMVLREKIRGENANEIPPPGFYYHPEKDSTFQLKSKPIELQCFDSSAPKFEIKKLEEKPGVGEYSIQHIDKLRALPFNREQRAELFSVRFDQQTPSANTYNLQKNFTRTTKHKQSENYPTPFGSGSCRFDSNQASLKKLSHNTPAPGSYNTKSFADKYKKNKKSSSQILYIPDYNSQDSKMSSQKKPVKMELQNDNYYDSDDLFNEGSTQIDNQEMPNSIYNQWNQKNSSSFQSKIKRFTQEYRSMTEDHIGPGSYDQKVPFNRVTFNKKPNANMNRQARKINFGQVNTACPKKVGPQSYDPNQDTIKSKKTYPIKLP